MTGKIYKYALDRPDNTYGAIEVKTEDILSILYVDEQDGLICVWAVVNPESTKSTKIFYVIGTGQHIPRGTVEHIGSVKQRSFIWHIFRDVDQLH